MQTLSPFNLENPIFQTILAKISSTPILFTKKSDPAKIEKRKTYDKTKPCHH